MAVGDEFKTKLQATGLSSSGEFMADGKPHSFRPRQHLRGNAGIHVLWSDGAGLWTESADEYGNQADAKWHRVSGHLPHAGARFDAAIAEAVGEFRRRTLTEAQRALLGRHYAEVERLTLQLTRAGTAGVDTHPILTRHAIDDCGIQQCSNGLLAIPMKSLERLSGKYATYILIPPSGTETPMHGAHGRLAPRLEHLPIFDW